MIQSLLSSMVKCKCCLDGNNSAVMVFGDALSPTNTYSSLTTTTHSHHCCRHHFHCHDPYTHPLLHVYKDSNGGLHPLADLFILLQQTRRRNSKKTLKLSIKWRLPHPRMTTKACFCHLLSLLVVLELTSVVGSVKRGQQQCPSVNRHQHHARKKFQKKIVASLQTRLCRRLSGHFQSLPM
jgi:hypothetical protein